MTKSYHMGATEFRRAAREVIDWIADYMEQVERYPVKSQVAPGQIYDALPKVAPHQPQPLQDVLADLHRVVLPGLTHWQSPSFFAFFPANTSGPSILADLLSAGLGVQGMLWETSPACTELEMRVLDWLVPAMGLPESFLTQRSGGGVIQDSASSALLCALLAAREKATSGRSNEEGVSSGLVVYAADHTHSSLDKAVRIAGLGTKSVRRVPCGEEGGMDASVLAEMVDADGRAGRTPCMVCATVGSTSDNVMDPLRSLGQVARRNDIWLHVDAAMSGTAALCPEFRHIQHGVEFADSYCFNPHKWMFTNFDCSCFWVARRDELIAALSIMPEYLRNAATDSGQVFDYRDWQVPLGRRFRALKLWMVLRHYGLAGLQHHVREHVALAQEFAEWVRADERFELTAEPPLNLVCFAHLEGDTRTAELRDGLNDSGQIYLTHTRSQGRLVLRMSIGGIGTTRAHVQRAWRLIQSMA